MNGRPLSGREYGPLNGGYVSDWRRTLCAANAIDIQYFALANVCCIAQKKRAFQASSPKLASPAGFGRVFFACRSLSE